MSSQFEIPGGNAKGTPIDEASDNDLAYWEGRISKDFDAGASRNPGRDGPLRDAMRAEIARRRGGGAAHPPVEGAAQVVPQQNAQIQRVPTDKLAGTFHDPNEANRHLQTVAAQYNLISPATSVGQIPEGCGVALTFVTVDIENDTYSAGNKLGLSKTTLQKIAAALGVSWEPHASGRVDDGSDPRYCRWKAVGTYRSFDGQVQTIVAEKEMDLRNGSPVLEGLQAQQAGKKNADGTPKNADSQIREMRLHIQQHAETKAQLRAIRSLGVKTGYTRAELQKPFAVARLMWTGQTNDPQLKRLFAEKQAEAMLGGQRALYGRQEHAPVGAIYSAPRLAPPPVGSVNTSDDDYPDDREMY